jgi:transcriptional regulator with XRE-family HTH domain
LAIEPLMSDQTILQELGQRLARRRVALGFTQAALAREAGIAKRTLERVEAGESTQTSTLVRILRALHMLDSLEAAIPAMGPRPMDLLKLRGKERRRASSKNRRKTAEADWSWGDET